MCPPISQLRHPTLAGSKRSRGQGLCLPVACLLAITFFCSTNTALALQSLDPRISRLLEQTQQALQRKQTDLVREHSQAILGRALSKLGEISLAFADYSVAERAFQEGLETNASLVEILQGLNAVYLSTQRYEKGVDVSRRILELDPEHHDTRYLLAMFYFMLDQLESAKVQLEDLYRTQPDNQSVAYSLALCHIKLDEKRRGSEILKNLEEGSKASAKLYLMLGKAYQEAQQFGEAVRVLKRALTLDSSATGANYHLALTYLMDQGMAAFSLAKLHLQLELSQDADRYYPNYLLAVVYFHERHFNQAIPHLEKAISAEPGNPDPYLYLGQCQLQMGAIDQAILALKKSIELTRNPGRNDFQLARTHYSLGMAFRQAGQPAEASANIESAQKLMKQAHLERVRQVGDDISGTQNHFRTADFSNNRLALAPQLQSLDPSMTAALENRAKFYRRAAAFAYQSLGAAAIEESHFSRAAEQLQKAIDWDPELPDLAYNLALAYLQVGRFREALVSAGEALRAKPKDTDVLQLLLYLARTMVKENLLEPALEAIDLLENATGPTGETRELRGRILALQGGSAKTFRMKP